MPLIIIVAMVCVCEENPRVPKVERVERFDKREKLLADSLFGTIKTAAVA